MSGMVEVLKWEKTFLFQCVHKYYFTLNSIFIVEHLEIYTFIRGTETGHHKDLFVIWWLHITRAKVPLNQNTVDTKKKDFGLLIETWIRNANKAGKKRNLNRYLNKGIKLLLQSLKREYCICFKQCEKIRFCKSFGL